MLDRLLKLAGDAPTHAVVVRMRPPDLERLVSEVSGDDVAPDEEEAEIHDGHDTEADDEVGEACPICDSEHAPLHIPPDLGMMLAHLVEKLAADGEHDADTKDETSDDDVHLMPT